MSTPILPFAVWLSSTNQNSIPANDNSLRNQILNGLVISDSTNAQPGSPANGDIYIITGAATGTQWATFDEFDLAIFMGGTWYAFAPVQGIVVNIAGTLKRWNGTAYVNAATGAGTGDVVGPASSTDGNLAVFDGATGKLLKDGGPAASAVLDVTSPANSSGTVTLDFGGKSRYAGAITLAANVTTLAFSNLPGAGKFAEYEMHITQDATGNRTFAIPASHKALGGSDTAIASAANAVTVLTASTVDNGTTWRYAMQESA